MSGRPEGGADEPLVSVVIPTHNRRAMVCDAIDSVFEQTYSNVEVVVVDDGSTDDTVPHLEERYGDRITLIRRREISNAAVARNQGVAASRGEFLAFLDSDDVWLPDKLRAQMEVMRAGGEEVVLVGGSCEYMDEEGGATLTPDVAPDSARYEDFCIRVRMPGSGSNNLLRRSTFERVGGFDEALVRGQDKDLWIRLLEHGEVRYVDAPTARIRIHGGERPNVDMEVIIRCRRRIDRKISDPTLRRKASAWSFYSFFRMLWPREKLRALRYLAASVLFWPTSIDQDTKRLRPALRRLLFR